MPANTIPGIPGTFTPEQAAANAASNAFGSALNSLGVRYAKDLTNPTPEAIQYYLDYAASAPNDDYGQYLRKEALENAANLRKSIDFNLSMEQRKAANEPIVLKPGQVGGSISQFPEQALQGQWDAYDLAKSQGKNPTPPSTPRPAHRPANMEAFASWYRLIGQPIPEGTKEGPTPYIDPWSPGGKYNPTKPTTTPQITNPLAPATTPNVQMPNPVQPQVNKSPAVNTANLTQAYQNQNQAVSSPTIQLPQQFQQNFNAAPSITPPTGTQGIKMPKFNHNAGFNTNWSDLFSVAHNRYTR